MTIILNIAEYVLIAAGGVWLVAHAVRSIRSGRRDDLKSAPIRLHNMGLTAVWFCLLANFLGWTVGASLANRFAPAGLTDALSVGWFGSFGSICAQLITIVGCVVVAQVFFLRGLKGLGLVCGVSRNDVYWIFKGWLIAIFATGITYLLTQFLLSFVLPNYSPQLHTVLMALSQPDIPMYLKVLALAGAAVIAPLGEEIFFRGMIQSAMTRAVPPKPRSYRHRWIAIGATSLIFGMLHLSTPDQIPALAVLGVVLGYTYERTGCLWVPILVHVLFNSKTLLWQELLNLSGDDFTEAVGWLCNALT
jgi:membrane protease YdiL (CAAX protease family)